MTRKQVRNLLLILSGALVLAAAIIFISLWNEGVTAQQNAQALLNASKIQPSAALQPSASASDLASALASDSYVQPDAPDVSGEDQIAAILQTELQGYSVIARLDIDTLDIHLPVLSATSVKALKVSICYYSGPGAGEEGNLVITGHNYANGAHFGKLDKIKIGDKVLVTNKDGKTFTYTVYALDQITPDNAEAVEDTKYNNELTLLTCISRGNRRLVVRCMLDK